MERQRLLEKEEFDKLVKKLYALADKMGQRITITVRRKSAFVSKTGTTADRSAESRSKAGKPAEAESPARRAALAGESRRREPGDD